MAELSGLIEQAAGLLRGARAAVALTGAGISTASGIPDFRSPHDGLWVPADPMQVASQLTFRYAPERFFEWVRPLAALIQRARPNAGHQALAELEADGRLTTVITQNIDELHGRAGSQKVLEIHGSLATATCVMCQSTWPGHLSLQRFVEDGQPPRCPACGSLLKPNVTLMGEQVPAGVMQAARSAVRLCDVLLVLGSSLEVMPAAALPVEALNHGARMILVNFEPTYLDARAAVLMHADVNAVLPRIAAAVRNETNAHT